MLGSPERVFLLFLKSCSGFLKGRQLQAFGTSGNIKCRAPELGDGAGRRWGWKNARGREQQIPLVCSESLLYYLLTVTPFLYQQLDVAESLQGFVRLCVDSRQSKWIASRSSFHGGHSLAWGVN